MLLCMALIGIVLMIMPAAAATGRTAPVGVPPITVNVSPAATQAVSPALERIAIVTATPAPQRTTVVTTVTTRPVVDEPQVIPSVTTIAARTALPDTVVNGTSGTAGSTPGKEVVSADIHRVVTISPGEVIRDGQPGTQTGVKDPKTGEEIPVDKSKGLPGGGISGQMPSAEDQWNNRFGAGGNGELGSGTPFDNNPFSNPMDDFLNQHGGNIADPVEAYGSSGAGISPAEGAEGAEGSSWDVSTTTNEDGSYTVWVSVDNGGDQGREYILLEFDAEGNSKNGGGDTQFSENSIGVESRMMQQGETDPVKGLGSRGQQYEGEGGYTGGTGHSANDLVIGGSRRITGKVPGSYDPGNAGLGQDTGSTMPAVFGAIETYVSQGGKVRGKGGYQPGEAGLGQDTGGGQNRVTGLKNAIAAQRFIIDPNARYAEQIPWWLERKVSPTTVNAAAGINGMQAGAVPGAATLAGAGPAPA
jgi:hypothetical protein